MPVPARRPAASPAARPAAPAVVVPPVYGLSDAQFQQFLAKLTESAAQIDQLSAQVQQAKAAEAQRLAEQAVTPEALSKASSSELGGLLFESMRRARGLRSPGWQPPNFFDD